MSSPASYAFRRGRLARLVAVPRDRRALLVEALAQLTIAAAAIRLRPFRQALRIGAIPLGQVPAVPPASLAEIVERVARLAPFRAMCFEQGIALQRMARRRGIDATLHYGVATDLPLAQRVESRQDGLYAHVWVSADGKGLLGHGESSSFRELLTSPE